MLATEVVIEVDLVPGLGQPGDALGHGLHPDCVGVRLQEDRGPRRVVAEITVVSASCGGPGLRSGTKEGQGALTERVFN